MTTRITLVATSARVAPGLLTAAAWDLLRAVPVRTASPGHPQLGPLRDAGVDVPVLTGPWAGPRALLDELAAVAGTGGQVAWLLDPAAPTDADRALLDATPSGAATSGAAAASGAVEHGAAGSGPGESAGPYDLRRLAATHELPGSALLEAVAVMDRLRSPGGCPWDAEQTHASLAPYLLEEAYEAYQAIEDGDLVELREELGDVLMQVLFHARVAAEAGTGGWDVDDVAAGLSAKLIRRHPHVFSDVEVTGPGEVVTNWDAIKAQEKGRTSVTEGVPLSAPALSLAAKLLRRSGKVRLPLALALPTSFAGSAGAEPGTSELAALVTSLASELRADPTGDPAADGAATATATATATAEQRIGDLLFAAVALAGALDVDPESALRGRSRTFRDRLARAERSAADQGVQAHELDAAGWGALWESAD